MLGSQPSPGGVSDMFFFGIRDSYFFLMMIGFLVMFVDVCHVFSYCMFLGGFSL